MRVSASSTAPALRGGATTLGAVIGRHALCGAVAFGMLCAADFGWRGSGPSAGVVHAAGLGVPSGALSGSALGLALAVIALLPLRARITAWIVCAAGFAAFSFRELGVIERLSGPYMGLAVIAIAGLVLFCGAGALIALAATPRDLGSLQGVRDSWLAGAAGRRRALALGALGLALIGLLAVDATFVVDGYPFIHEVLRKSARFVATLLLVQGSLALSTRALLIAAAAAAAIGLYASLRVGGEREGMIASLRQAPLPALAVAELRAVGDPDADGFSAWLGGGDCAPFEPDVNPRAKEIPANGLDDNCRLGDLAQAPEQPQLRLDRASSPKSPSFVLITIDALRADHVGAYGYSRATTPRIDAWFREGTRYAQAIAPGAYTTITVPSLMYGAYPRRLAWTTAWQTSRFALSLSGPPKGLAPGETILNAHLIARDPNRPTLAEILRSMRYRTVAIVDDGGSEFLSREIIGRGIERFVHVSDDAAALWDPGGDERVASAAVRELQAAPPAQPFFLWLHFFGAHAPDAKHDGVPSFDDDVIGRYDHEIANVDRQLGRVFDALDALGKTRELVVLLTSDHGELFSPLGRAHGLRLAEAELQVPLFARGPGFGRAVVQDPVSLVDLAPTLLALASARAMSGLDGVDLLDASARAKRKFVLSDGWRFDARGRITSDRTAATGRTQRVVYESPTNTLESFARGSDRLRFPPASELEHALFEYLELTGPRPDELGQ